MGTLITGGIYGDNTGETYVKCLWFESISSGTSGTLTVPTQGTVVLDQWAAGVDALASTISSGVPAFVSPSTAGGVTITATLNSAAAWTISGTPSAYPIAIVYVYQVKLRYLDYTKTLGSYELIPQAVGVSTDVTSFASVLSSADNTVQKALDTIDDHGHNANKILIPDGVGTPTYDDLQDYLNVVQSSGRLTGGALTAHSPADGTVDISAMEGMIHTANTLGSPLIYFKKAASNLALISGAVNYVLVTYTSTGGGTLTYSASTTRPADETYDSFVLGRCWCLGTSVEPITTGANIYDLHSRLHDRLITKYGVMDHVSGALISAHATPLRLSCTGSVWYAGNTKMDLSAATPDTFMVWYKSGSATWIESAEMTLFSDIFNGAAAKTYESYQNGNSLGALGSNKYGVFWVFMCPEGDLYIVLGTATYANIGAAQAATVPSSLPPYLVNWGRLIGRVICQNAGAAFYSVESTFATSFTLSAATDHSSLANLTADDHTQYLLVTGARALTGDIDFAGSYQCHDLQAPAANGEAIRATAKITEVLLESATDLKHTQGTDTTLGGVKAGATQLAAGAAAGEIWKTSGHASLPDNVLMIGV
jgi:hypothetical protein